MKSQNDIVLEHLRKHGTITSLEAVNRYGITRLAARISDLRHRGIEIYSRDIEVYTSDKRKTRVSEYRLP